MSHDYPSKVFILVDENGMMSRPRFSMEQAEAAKKELALQGHHVEILEYVLQINVGYDSFAKFF